MGRRLEETRQPLALGGYADFRDGRAGHTRAPWLLNPQAGLTKFRTTARSVPDAVAPFVDNYWLTWWDLRGEPPFEQHLVPHPRVQAVFASDGASVHGVMRGLFTKVLDGRAHVLGMRFRPGGFRPFFGAPVGTITGRSVPVEQVFGPDACDLTQALRATEDEDEQVALADAFLLRRLPPPDPTSEVVSDIVEHIVASSEVTRVDVLAEKVAMSVRQLQRLFAEYVGVGPKWVILRHRIHEAVWRASAGDVDWASVAAELGYSDQAHFVRDFTTTVRMSPVRYARFCR